MTTRSTAKARQPAPLARTQGMALHRQLYMVLRDYMRRRVWATGSALPTEEALCTEFGVSRITVRRALGDLQAQGLVERRHGLGTFVLGDSTPPPQVTLSFLDFLRKHAEETKVQVLEVRSEVPPADIARLLQIAPGAKALHAVRLRFIDDVPVMMTTAWVPDHIGRRITAATLKKQALYQAMMAQGVVFGRVVQEITAEAADPTRARQLHTDVGAPLLKIVRLLHDKHDQPVQHLVALTPPERGRVLMEIAGDQINTLSAGYVDHRK